MYEVGHRATILRPQVLQSWIPDDRAATGEDKKDGKKPDTDKKESKAEEEETNTEDH